MPQLRVGLSSNWAIVANTVLSGDDRYGGDNLPQTDTSTIRIIPETPTPVYLNVALGGLTAFGKASMSIYPSITSLESTSLLLLRTPRGPKIKWATQQPLCASIFARSPARALTRTLSPARRTMGGHKSIRTYPRESRLCVNPKYWQRKVTHSQPKGREVSALNRYFIPRPLRCQSIRHSGFAEDHLREHQRACPAHSNIEP